MQKQKLPSLVTVWFMVGMFVLTGVAADDTIAAGGHAGDSVLSLDKMVVTATRTKRRMSQTPASVSVIQREDIARSPAKSIDDLLQYETGVQMKRVVGLGEGIPSDIIIRGIPGGLSATRTLVLVDGIPTNASGTPFLILNEIPMDAIQQVEIVRGPYSSLYGANAFSGVINILTRTGDGKPGLSLNGETACPFSVLSAYDNGERTMRTSLREGWSDTYWNANGTSSGGNDRVNYLVSGGLRTVGNYLLRDYAITKTGTDTFHLKNENYDYHDVRLFGKMGIFASDKISLDLHARFFDSELGFGRTRRLAPDSVDIVTRGRKIVAGPIAKFSLNDDATILAKTYFRTLIGQFWNEEPLPSGTYVPGYWRSQSYDWQTEVQGFFRIGAAQELTTGIEYLNNFIHFGRKENVLTDSIIPTSRVVDERIQNTAVYFQDEISVVGRLHIVPGFRWDYHSAFGSAFSPKMGVSYQVVEWLRLKNSIGRGFRAPTLSELYMPELTIRPDFVLMPNPHLKPEYIWSVDAACELTPVPNLKTHIGFYNNDMQDLIGQTADLGSGAVTHQNITKAWSRGLELENIWKFTEWVSITGNYVFQKSRNESAGTIRKLYFKADKQYSEKDLKVPLDYIPDHAFNIGLQIRKKIGNVVVEGTVSEAYKGKRYYFEWTEIDPLRDIKLVIRDDVIDTYFDPPFIPLASYWRTDIGLKCTVRGHLWFAVHIQNLFNATYEESGGTLVTGCLPTLKIGGDI